MKAKCSERFLRGCLWGVRKLKEEDQIDIVLRRACQKLRINTQQGCFTDPDITKKYIERCYGQETWDAVRKEIAMSAYSGSASMQRIKNSVIRRTPSPCKDCTARHLGCHSECNLYSDWQ